MALTGAQVKELRVLTELASLLHEKGHAVLSGESKLSLTTQSIVLLNQALEAVGENRSDDRAPKLRQNPRLDQLRKDVMFLREFLQKTNSVKIIHRSGTIQGAVQITYFNTLQKLEIKKVPIHLIEGLHQLRSRLKSITCTRCIPVLQDLFETCGGDMASPMSWVQLNEACLSYNSIVSLDSSLRLLPALEILDVSHNCLERLENHLQYLTELVHINLGYNQVSVVPQFSLSVRTKLKTLILRNNRLEQLEGVEDLVNLEELDVTNNCLSDHSVLDILHMLDNLSLLCLLGNPLSYHRSHRALSVEHVSPVAARSKFILDGKKLTEAEKMLTVNSRVHRSPSRRPTQVAHSLISDSQQITNKFTFSDSDAIATSLPVNAAGKKRTKAKAKIRSRKALIAEFESSTDTTTGVSDSSPAPSPMLHRRVMPHPQATTSNKEEFEVMREHYGSDWLRAFNSNPREEVKSEPSTSVEKPSALTEDDIFLNDSCTGLNSLDPGSSGTEKEDVVNNNDTGTEEVSLFTKTTSSQDETCQVLARESSEHGMEWKRTDSEQHEYYGVESEPFIVILPDDTHLFLSVNDRYLLEKDMNGAVLEMLDLKLLESVGSAENGQEVTEGAEPVLLPTVRLTFGYVRRDRRERTYVMEDQANAEELENLLKPRLEAKMQLEKLKQQLQCLKCSSQFLKSEAKIGGREGRKPKGDAVLSSSLGDKPTADLGEEYHCPTCGSEMVVEMSVPMRDLQPASPIPVGSLPTTLTLPPQSCSTPQKPNNPQTPHSNYLVNGLKEHSPRPAPLIGSLENVILAQKVGNRKRASLPAVLPPASASHLWKPQGETRAATSGISVAGISEVPEGGESSNECLQNSFSDIKRAEGKASNVSDFRLRQNSTGSDIAILCNPSEGVLNVLKEAGDEEKGGRTAVQTVSPVIERSVSLDANNVSASPQNNIALSDPRVTEEPAPTPLSVNVCNSMVSSVYENSINALPPQSDLGSDTVTCNGSIDTGIHGVSDEVDADISIYDNPSKAANRETQVTQAAESDDSGLAGTEVTNGSSVTCVSVPSASKNGHNLPEDQTNPVCDNTCHTNSSNRDEFAVTDHMLKLHFHMSVLKESEECICMLQCGVVQYMVQEEFEGILLLATENIYILKILPDIRKKKGTEPTAWLKCIEAQPLSELEYIDMGFGKQSFRLEFNTDCSSYSFLVCDLERCQAFVHLFRASLQELDHKTIPGEDVDRATVDNLSEQVFTEAERRAGNDLLEASDLCSHDIYYVKGQLLEDGKRRWVGVVVNEWDMYLVTENHQWPLPRLQAPLSEDMRGQQFTLIVRQHINNILQIQLFKDKSNEVSIMFCDEEKGEESEWRITMATPRCVSSLVNWVKGPWEEEFGVELEIVSVSDDQT